MVNGQPDTYPSTRPVAPAYHDSSSVIATPGNLRRISWGAVIAGVVIALVIQLLLTMLGTGIGLSTVEPAQYDSPSVQALSVGAGVWWSVSALISLFAGGWTAGRLGGIPREKDSMLHGLLTWGVATLISAYLVSSAVGNLIDMTSSAVQSVASGAGQAVSAVAPELASQAKTELQQSGINLDDLKNEALKTLRQTGKPALQPDAIENRAQNTLDQAQSSVEDAAKNPEAVDEEFSSLFDRLFRQGQETASQVDRDALANVVAARTGMSKEEATATVAKWDQQYQQLKAKAAEQAEKLKADARVAAEKTAQAIAQTSIWGFIALVLGAIAAAIGAVVGRPKNVVAAETS